MPIFTMGESNMTVLPVSYSPSAVERCLVIVDEFDVAVIRAAIIYDAATPRAAIIDLDLTPDILVAARHRVLAMLNLAEKRPCAAGATEYPTSACSSFAVLIRSPISPTGRWCSSRIIKVLASASRSSNRMRICASEAISAINCIIAGSRRSSKKNGQSDG